MCFGLSCPENSWNIPLDNYDRKIHAEVLNLRSIVMNGPDGTFEL